MALRAPRCAHLALLLLLAPGLVHPAAAEEPRVVASSYRFDFGSLVPGETRSGNLTIGNEGARAVAVRLVQDGAQASAVRFERDLLLLDPGARETVGFEYALPLDALPGNRADVYRLVLSSPDSSSDSASGTLSAGTAVVFTARARSVGVFAIEAPSQLLPEGRLEGRVLVVNTDSTPATVDVALALVDASGSMAAATRTAALPVPAGATVAFSFAFPPGPLPGGAYELRASLSAQEGAAHVSPAPFASHLSVGTRGLSLSVVSVRDQGDGDAIIQILARNTGTLPFVVRPRVEMRPLDDTSLPPFDLDLAPFELAPGAERVVEAEFPLAAGSYAVRAVHPSSDASSGTVVEGAGSLVMSEPRAAAWREAWARLSSPVVLAVGAGLAIVAGAAWLVARAASSRGLKAVRLPERRPSWTSVPWWPGERVAVLVDLCTLHPAASDADVSPADILREGAKGRRVTAACAYYVAGSEEEAREARAGIVAEGLAPRVTLARPGPRSRGRGAYLAVAMDAFEQAAAGATIVLATSDPSMLDLARRLRERGRRVEFVTIRGAADAAFLGDAEDLTVLPRRAPTRFAQAAGR